MTTIYLDNSATTRPTEEVIRAMDTCMREGFYNPSALYGPALVAEKQMRAGRERILQQLGSTGRVTFTSGGTEANNLAILGSLSAKHGKGKVLYSAGEHPAVIEACRHAGALGYETAVLPLDASGRIDLEVADELVTPDTLLMCVMHINNETGAVQPLEELARLRAQRCARAHFHVDGVQAFLRHPLACDRLGIDTYALSAHKIHGPKGVGALWTAKGTRLSPCTYGGGQEEGLRAGTENTCGIAGLMEAIRSYPKAHLMRQNKLLLWERLRQAVPQAMLNGADPASDHTADHILNVSFPPVRAQTMLHALEAEGIYVGNGSACSSRRRKDSHVLAAMGVSAAARESAIRFSLSPFNTADEMVCTAQAVQKAYERLRVFVRR